MSENPKPTSDQAQSDEAEFAADSRKNLFGTLFAVFLMTLIALGYNAYVARSDYSTAKGEISRVTLPDGTRAILNTASALRLAFNDDERGLELVEGEVWFEVHGDPQRPFRIRSRNGVIEASAGSFSVRNEFELVVTSVTEGTVTVNPPPMPTGDSSPPATIAAGQSIGYASLSTALRPVVPFDAATTLAWRDGHVRLVEQPLASALDELNRYRSGRIMLWPGAAAKVNVGGDFPIDSIDSSLESLAGTHELRLIHFTPWFVLLY